MYKQILKRGLKDCQLNLYGIHYAHKGLDGWLCLSDGSQSNDFKGWKSYKSVVNKICKHTFVAIELGNPSQKSSHFPPNFDLNALLEHSIAGKYLLNAHLCYF